VSEGEKAYMEHTPSLTWKPMSWNKLDIFLLLLENYLKLLFFPNQINVSFVTVLSQCLSHCTYKDLGKRKTNFFVSQNCLHDFILILYKKKRLDE
jgi:hypothetical protein